jgi:hypothetical protein
MTSESCNDRVIALLDLDCFYAQVEAVRLGIPWETTPMVVLQWGMALAVSYPARALGIKRGDYWNQISKTSPETIGIHVEMEVLEMEVLEEDVENVEERLVEGGGEDNREKKYKQQFNMSEEKKKEVLLRENGFIPDRSKGKASLEVSAASTPSPANFSLTTTPFRSSFHLSATVIAAV